MANLRSCNGDFVTPKVKHIYRQVLFRSFSWLCYKSIVTRSSSFWNQTDSGLGSDPAPATHWLFITVQALTICGPQLTSELTPPSVALRTVGGGVWHVADDP